MGLLGKKKKTRDEIIAEGIASVEEEAAAEQEKEEETFSSGNPKLDMEITRIKARLESFNEIRKANSERFSRISEQMGELRGMIMDTNKTLSKIEVSATKAIDLVESVHPEKLMTEIRKQEGKAEALKANIESNEALMKDIMEELKKMKQQMGFYKGIEQVAKLNEEVKQEILDAKKVEATIERHADKAESIFLDLEKKFAEFEKFEKTVDELEKISHTTQRDFDKMKLQLSNKSDKKEFVSLMGKFTEFERHTGNILKLLDERSKHMKQELRDTVKKIKEQLRRKHGIVIDERGVREEKLPEEESEYLEKVDEGTKKVEEKTEEKKEETSVAAGVKTEKKEEEKIGLMDVLKKRKIITEKLSDEKEPEQKEEVKTEETTESKKDSEPATKSQKPKGEKTEEIPPAGSK